MRRQYEDDNDDLYDDIDEVGTYDYGSGDDSEFIESETDDYEDESIDESEISDEDLWSESEDDNNDEEQKELKDKITGFKYTGEKYDPALLNELYYENGSEDAQLEAINKAVFYAKRRVFDAQHFIIDIIKNPESCASDYVLDKAQTAFYLFFRNYVRTEVEKFYRARASAYANVNEVYETIQEAMIACWEYILKYIDHYDKDIASLTTYYRSIIRDAIINYEATGNGRKSKTSMMTDKIVSKAQTEMKEAGLKPTSRAIALRTGLTVEQVKISMARLLAENTMSRIDADQGIANRKKQEQFILPEERVLMEEQKAELVESFRHLTTLEKRVYELCNGFRIYIDNHEIIETNSYSFNEVAKQLNIDVMDVRHLERSAQEKLHNIVAEKMSGTTPKRKTDTLLKNRNITFSKSQEDDDLLTIIDSITNISDGDDLATENNK